MDQKERDKLLNEVDGTSYFKLAGHKTVPCSMQEWSDNLQHQSKVVAQDKLECGALVSTVFLGLNHSFIPGGPPILFETMIFDWVEPSLTGAMGESPHEDYQERYCTWDEAVEGHKRAVEYVLAHAKPLGGQAQ